MALVELSDLVGAIEAYIAKKHNMTLDALLNMKEATARSFKVGHRSNK
jgi:hypothetical protein